ncbi:hypothetical protein [Flavobacterium cyclinae]|uniref:hypothetical protein n=1 Tax=Flavobacterium cyclinae TaxID=2895947 RepID=UPI001E351973|nr:hypothetical protein [Flavobacterium cyclinae]UGS21055.1 hypothetical protein LOS86_00080 [Flavobacterium cyclinae]
MKKTIYTIALSLFILNVNADNFCDDAAFNAMEWAAEAGLDDQEIANAGNYAYAVCWLMNRNLIRDSGSGL